MSRWHEHHVATQLAVGDALQNGDQLLAMPIELVARVYLLNELAEREARSIALDGRQIVKE